MIVKTKTLVLLEVTTLLQPIRIQHVRHNQQRPSLYAMEHWKASIEAPNRHGTFDQK
jgi:hypothetical protein